MTFGQYQASDMATSKWYSFDYLLKDSMEVYGIHHLHGGLYDQRNKQFKMAAVLPPDEDRLHFPTQLGDNRND